MNRLTSSGSCRRCRRWLEGEWATAETQAARHAISRQMHSGVCDECQRAWQAAALEFIRASDDMRVLNQCLVATGRDVRGAFQTGMPAQVLGRVTTAERRCVELGMWASVRPEIYPESVRIRKYDPRELRHRDHNPDQ
jgi:hypothetical protein